ncbi:MAG TPA: hypothetical protein VEV83_05485, partial [Parafilimonas sp.]|nr:hypothetical protein [Parafilimonas sp.]
MKCAIAILLWPLIFTFFSCRKQFSEQTFSSRSNNHFLSSTPNIIVILGDDVGYEIPTYTGGQSYSTTNIDYLAANG